MEVFGNVLLVQAPPEENITKSGIHLLTQTAIDQTQPVRCKVLAVPHEVKKVNVGDIVVVDAMAVLNLRMCYDKEARQFFVKHEQVYGKLDPKEIEISG